MEPLPRCPFTASPRETFITLHQRQWRRALFRIWPFVGPTCNAPDDERDYEVGYGKPRHSRGRIQWVDRSERPVLLAIVILGERVRGPQLLGLAAIVVGISLMYRVHVNLSARSLWVMALPLAAAAIRGVVQPIIKFGLEWWPNPTAAVVVSYTVSSTVLIVSALVRTRWTIPDVDHRGALWFAVVGLCNGLSVLAMYAALEYGPVAVVSPIVAGYPLVILLLSPAFLEGEHVGLQMIGGVTSAVCGVVLLLVT